MNKTYMWSLIAAVAVVLIGVGISLFYTSPTKLGTTTNTNGNPLFGPNGSSTVTIGNGDTTVLTPSTRFQSGGTTTIDISRIEFAFVSPGAGKSYTTGGEMELTIKLADSKQELLVLGFELYDAQTKKFVADTHLPSIQSNGPSLTPSVMWSIPKTLPAGTYYLIGYVNRTPQGVQSPAFEIMKNPITLTASANNQFGTVMVREKGESVDVMWRGQNATSCTVGLTSDLERGLPANGRKTIFTKPGDTILISCEAGNASVSERIRVVKK